MSIVIKLKFVKYVYLTFFTTLISGSVSVMIYDLFFLDSTPKLAILYSIILFIGIIGIYRWRKTRK